MMMTMIMIIIIITTAGYCLIKHSLGSGVADAVSGLLTHIFFPLPK